DLSLQTSLPAIERGRGRSEGAMAGDDQVVDNARMSSRPLPQGFGGLERIHLYDAGAEELLKPAQRHGLRNIVVMPEC
ncbi:MAG TPA: hypothetical protein VML54_15775, partial [Candidatus Limnocylindrales bacterium]|nr:hypothetical protein [Candidatus Limnocylindrales bacterium]